MCYEYCCDVCFALNTFDFFTSLQTKTSVQVGKWFVQQKNSWHFYQSTSDSNTLLLTTGKFAWLTFHKVVNLNEFCSVVCTFQHLSFCHLVFTLQVFEWEHDVLLNCHVWIQRIVLEYQTNTSVFWREFSNVVIAEENFTAGWFLQTANHVQCCTFTATGWSKQTDEFSVGNLKVKLVYSNNFVVIFVSAGKDFCQILENYFHVLFLPFVLFCLLNLFFCFEKICKNGKEVERFN